MIAPFIDARNSHFGFINPWIFLSAECHQAMTDSPSQWQIKALRRTCACYVCPVWYFGGLQNPWPYSVLNPCSMIGFTIRHCLLSNNIGYRFVDCIPIVFSCGLRWLAFWPFSTLQEQVSFPVPGFYLLVAIFCYGWLCYGWSMWITNLSHVATLARMMMNVIMYWWCVMLSCHFYVCIFLCGYLSDTICFF